MSLRSIILKGRFYAPDYISRERMEAFVGYAFAGLNDPQTKLINAQSVWDDTVIPPRERRTDDAWDHLLNFEAIPRPKPPFERIWLEATMVADSGFGRQRTGALVLRVEGTENILHQFRDAPGMPEEAIEQIKIDRPATLVNALLIHDYEGSATPSGNCIYWLNEDGKFLWSFRMSTLALEEQSEEEKAIRYMQMRMRQGWVLHSFARMNCVNTRLVAIPDGHKHHRHHANAASNTWHVIEVGAAPRIRYAGSREPSEDGRHVRFHWVRGHYADYTQGRGLFGNPNLRKLFWIPEHQAGDKDQGAVISGYDLMTKQ